MNSNKINDLINEEFENLIIKTVNNAFSVFDKIEFKLWYQVYEMYEEYKIQNKAYTIKEELLKRLIELLLEVSVLPPKNINELEKFFLAKKDLVESLESVNLLNENGTQW